MKKNQVQYAHDEARMYRRYYRPNTNPVYLLKSLLCVFLSGEAPYGRPSYIERKKQLLK
ncbi:hypothetical protein [Parasegetibacter sp. NRK P23]|uniref:hypothetical protein n=1 Tax=Parasegetibacter sp. NRK P23 TaxID=2942999 RepID=UPI002043A5ED|nr:hypothetical protein [Parasegetibacter sp. NRK P23]MCM5529744.1 hypothetical protein [Parasegetibacter sp. NRK P23]